MPSLKDIILGNMGGAFEKGVGMGAGAFGQRKEEQAKQAQMEQAQAFKDQEAARQKDELAQLLQANPKASVRVGEYGVNPADNEGATRMLQLKMLEEERARRQEERDNRMTQGLADDVSKAGTAQAVSALKHAEETVPGIATGKAKFKSVGGISRLIPDWGVSVGEKMGFMPKGASQERATIQDMMNTKIYDSSGKAISIPEMDRLQKASGLFGVADSDILNKAIAAQAETTKLKSEGAAAGFPQHIRETFQKRGGLAPKQGGDIYDLMSGGDVEKAELLRLRAAKKSKGGR